VCPLPRSTEVASEQLYIVTVAERASDAFRPALTRDLDSRSLSLREGNVSGVSTVCVHRMHIGKSGPFREDNSL
jgi:hypothetical protein